MRRSDGARTTRSGPPGPRFGHGLAHDARSGLTVLFGGSTQARRVPKSDTWGWDGNVWSQVSEVGPTPRAFHGLATCPTARIVILFGGWEGAPSRRSHFADSWAWNGAGWQRLEGESPPAGGVYAMARDATGRGVLIHGEGRKAEGAAWHLEGRTWLHRDGRWTEKASAS